MPVDATGASLVKPKACTILGTFFRKKNAKSKIINAKLVANVNVYLACKNQHSK
jgi:hypothetical protein